WSACHCYASELFLLFYQEMARINRDNLIKYQRVSTLELIGVFAGFGVFYAVLDVLFYVKYIHLLI
ncbi:hypothetical protein, partial [Butyrivibrio sp. WCE2006]|uniref:hypothetical protein n=1 Tax=Butyrivibrio sp. WCE2006 TaxID=1410611 RepID=UPI0005D29B3A